MTLPYGIFSLKTLPALFPEHFRRQPLISFCPSPPPRLPGFMRSTIFSGLPSSVLLALGLRCWTPALPLFHSCSSSPPSPAYAVLQFPLPILKISLPPLPFFWTSSASLIFHCFSVISPLHVFLKMVSPATHKIFGQGPIRIRKSY